MTYFLMMIIDTGACRTHCSTSIRVCAGLSVFNLRNRPVVSLPQNRILTNK